MLVITPAIDIRKGNVVRLYRGLYSKETIYSKDPITVAKQWKNNGAEILHIIDLDGAFFGRLKNLEIVKKIISEVGLKIHLGGGIRSQETIKEVLEAGVHKVIMSTVIFQNENFLKGLDKGLLQKIIVSIDSKSGIVLDKGWTGQTSLSVEQAIGRIEGSGIGLAVITDISLDGTLSGPNIELLKRILRTTKIQIIAAGGISSIEDIKTLCALKKEYVNLYGAIIGKALYEGTINLREAINCAK